MPKVIVQFGGQEWPIDLREGVNVVGRSPQAAVPIKDPSMSREHCDILVEGGVATVVDRGSMNGTLINGVRMDRKVLSAGDRIQIGKVTLFFEQKQEGGPAPAAPKAAEATPEGVEDYSFWQRESGGLVSAIVALVVLGVIAAGAVYLFRTFAKAGTIPVDADNLIGAAGRFDPGPEGHVLGWGLKPGLSSRLSVVEGSAKEGKTCLQLEKSVGSADLLAEILYQDPLDVPSGGAVELSSWIRSDAASVSVGLKVTWLATRKGPVVMEEAAEPAAWTSSWTQASQTFTPPPGATAFQPAFIVTGRGGRVFFDDVRVRARPATAPVKPVELGVYSTTAVSSGILGVNRGASRILHNVQIFLASDKEGTMYQVAARGGRISADPAARTLTASGRLDSPADLRPVDFELEARGVANGLLLGCRLRGDPLKQVDRIGISLLLIGGDIKGDYSSPVSRLLFRGEAGDFILEIADGLMRVSGERLPGTRRVKLEIPLQRGVAEAAFSFVLRPGGGASADPRAEARKAESEGRMTDAVAALKELLAVTREEPKKDDLLRELRRLEEIEESDWKAVQGLVFRAELVGLKPYFEEALLKLDQYERRWPGGRHMTAARAERPRLMAGMAAAAADRETERAARLLKRAREHAAEGQKVLARELAEAVRKHYPSSPAAAEAAEFLKTLGSE
ncbi:MAG TPA: FHA domain-containing protein [Planctomycetota bacterium]